MRAMDRLRKKPRTSRKCQLTLWNRARAQVGPEKRFLTLVGEWVLGSFTGWFLNGVVVSWDYKLDELSARNERQLKGGFSFEKTRREEGKKARTDLWRKKLVSQMWDVWVARRQEGKSQQGRDRGYKIEQRKQSEQRSMGIQQLPNH